MDEAAQTTTDDELTARQREILEFERTWWQFDEPRDELIRARFGCATDEYYAELNRLLEHPGALAHDPLVVRRFQRRRLRRRGTLHQQHDPSQDRDPRDLEVVDERAT